MGKIDSKLHSPGVMTYRATGDLTGDHIEEWRDALTKFLKENDKKGACGVLIDACEVDALSMDAIDSLFELLADPAEMIRDIRLRFALVGVKPFTQRFLKEVMPLEEVKHIRARFFHEVSEEEALAWLQAMVSSADALPEVKTGSPEVKSAIPDEPAKPEQGKDGKTGDKKTQPKGVALLLKGQAKSDSAKEEAKAAPVASDKKKGS